MLVLTAPYDPNVDTTIAVFENGIAPVQVVPTIYPFVIAINRGGTLKVVCEVTAVGPWRVTPDPNEIFGTCDIGDTITILSNPPERVTAFCEMVDMYFTTLTTRSFSVKKGDLICFVSYNATGYSDSQGNAYTVKTPLFGQSPVFYYTKASATGSMTITVTQPPARDFIFLDCTVWVYRSSYAGFGFNQYEWYMQDTGVTGGWGAHTGAATGMMGLFNGVRLSWAQSLAGGPPAVGNEYIWYSDTSDTLLDQAEKHGHVGFSLADAGISAWEKRYGIPKNDWAILGFNISTYTSDPTIGAIGSISFTCAITRPTGMTRQYAFRGARGPVLGVVDQQTSLDLTLPYAPAVGNTLVVGAIYNNGNNPGSTTMLPSDSYGNDYEDRLSDYIGASAGGPGATGQWYTAPVLKRPSVSSEAFRVTVSIPIQPAQVFQADWCVGIREVNGSPSNIAATGYRDFNNITYLLRSKSLNAAKDTVMIGMAGTPQATGGGYQWFTITPQDGYTARSSWLYGSRNQIFENRAWIGCGSLMDKTALSSGSDDVEVITNAANGEIMLIAIVTGEGYIPQYIKRTNMLGR